MKRLIVSAPRGSGGAVTHLRQILPRLLHERPDWHVEVHSSADLLQEAFGRQDASWMYPIGASAYSSRIRWEMMDMPGVCAHHPGTLIYAPFGPLLNVAAAGHAVWASRNIIPLLPPETWEVEDADRFRALALRYDVAFHARVAPRTICVSEFARASLTRLANVSGDSIRVIPHGAELADPDAKCATAEAEILRRTPYILNVGQPTPYRRTRELILGYANLAAKRNDIPRLALIGEVRPVDRQYGEECLRLVEPLVRAGRAVCLGRVAHGDVLALTNNAYVVAYPSVHEDCPNAVLEALAGGRVIVCADIPATRELAGAEAALFVREPKPADIAEALESAVFDDELRVELGRKAVERARLFTWDRATAATLHVLEEAFEVLSAGRDSAAPRASLRAPRRQR